MAKKIVNECRYCEHATTYSWNDPKNPNPGSETIVCSQFVRLKDIRKGELCHEFKPDKLA